VRSFSNNSFSGSQQNTQSRAIGNVSSEEGVQTSSIQVSGEEGVQTSSDQVSGEEGVQTSSDQVSGEEGVQTSSVQASNALDFDNSTSSRRSTPHKQTTSLKYPAPLPKFSKAIENDLLKGMSFNLLIFE